MGFLTYHRIKTYRVNFVAKARTKWLFCSPQKRCECVRVLKASPKKPNSAKRAVGISKVSKRRKEIFIFIPGIGHTITTFTSGLFRGGKTQDLPRMYYKVIRGGLNISGVLNRTKARSKYGVRRFR